MANAIVCFLLPYHDCFAGTVELEGGRELEVTGGPCPSSSQARDCTFPLPFPSHSQREESTGNGLGGLLSTYKPAHYS